MTKSIYTALFITMLTFSVGCGGSNNSSTDDSANSNADEPTTTTLSDTYTSWTVAKNSLVRDTSKTVGVNTMKVLIEPGKQIGEDDISKTVDFVLGKINGVDTGLGINQNYTNGTKMIVRIYDANNNILKTSEKLTYTGGNIEFNNITF